MFDFDSSSLNRSRWLLDGIAIVDIYAAWYMLLSINPNLPKVDPILAKIYFSEYGVNTDGLTDTAVMTMATEYDSKIRVFYRKCIVQRLVDIIERFAKICYDPRLPHIQFSDGKPSVQCSIQPKRNPSWRSRSRIPGRLRGLCYIRGDDTQSGGWPLSSLRDPR